MDLVKLSNLTSQARHSKGRADRLKQLQAKFKAVAAAEDPAKEAHDQLDGTIEVPFLVDYCKAGYFDRLTLALFVHFLANWEEQERADGQRLEQEIQALTNPDTEIPTN